MKKLSMTLLALLVGVVCRGEVTFALQFPAKEFTPKATSTVRLRKFSCGPENFISGPGKTFAFLLSDHNAKAKECPVYNAVGNVPLGKGSLEICFKILKRLPGTGVRLTHVYSPAAESRDLLIYYCFVDTMGNLKFIIQVKSTQYVLRIPEREFNAGEFNTIKLTWNAKQMACYLNGELIEDRALPPEFAGIAAQKRKWSSFEILPVYPKSHDSWENRAAVASLIFRDEDK